MTSSSELDRTETHKGPPLVVLAVLSTVLFFAAVIGSTIMAGGEHFPSPYLAEHLSSFYFTQHPNAVRLNAFLQFGAAVPLGLFTAVCVSRLRFLGLDAAGLHIALFGGIAASIMASLSALVMWTISWQEIASSPFVHALHVLEFAFGGPGHVVAFGLLVAGVSVSAGIAKLVPRWIMWLGLVVAVFAELSSFTLIAYPATYFLPAARVLGFAWLISVGITLPKSRARSGGRSEPMARGTWRPAHQN
jgi:hypothetical protein